VATFDVAALQTAVGLYVALEPTAIAVSLSAASVLADVTMTTTSRAGADEVYGNLVALNTTEASRAFNVTVLSITVIAPVPVLPLPSPPLSPSPAQPDSSPTPGSTLQSVSSGLSVADGDSPTAVVASVLMALLLVGCCVSLLCFVWWRKKNQHRRFSDLVGQYEEHRSRRSLEYNQARASTDDTLGAEAGPPPSISRISRLARQPAAKASRISVQMARSRHSRSSVSEEPHSAGAPRWSMSSPRWSISRQSSRQSSSELPWSQSSRQSLTRGNRKSRVPVLRGDVHGRGIVVPSGSVTSANV